MTRKQALAIALKDNFDEPEVRGVISALDKAGAFSDELMITKAQAHKIYDIARVDFDESEFEDAWSLIALGI